MWKSWVPVLNQQSRTHLAPDYSLLFGLGVDPLPRGRARCTTSSLEIEASREAEEEVLRYRVLAREAELRAFKAQVDPHFLFNSLNAVASLCGSRPLEAREMAQTPGRFLPPDPPPRRARTDHRWPRRSISCTRYLAIEQVRFGDRLTIARRRR